MNILIIGGSRFVGPYIVDLLLKNKHNVTVFNRGVIQSLYSSKVKFVVGDRNNGFNISKKFDVVIDTCAYEGKQTAQAINELEFDYFLNFSTVAVYQDSLIFPISEEFPIGGIEAMGTYGVNKASCEKVLLKTNLQYANIRPTYILGPKNYCDRENFIYASLLAKKPIVIPGNGEALIQFVFAEEVAQAIVRLVENKITGSYNIVGDEYITLNGLVKSMGEIAGLTPIIKYNQEADGAKHIEEEFPFANANFVYTNGKIKKLGVHFESLLKSLKRDFENYYKFSIGKPIF